MAEKTDIFDPNLSESGTPPPLEKVAANLSELTDEQRRLIAERYGNRAEADNVAPSADMEFLFDKIVNMTMEEAIEVLTIAIDYHSDDRNFDYGTMEKIKLLVEGQEASGLNQDDYEFDCKAEAAVLKYHSPYPEVRSIADPFDDPTIPVETIRSYFLGMLWSIIGMGVNTFFAPRFPSITLSSAIVQLFLYPCGKFLELVLPDWGITVFGTRHSLNPGPWSYKEQMFATITFNVSLTTIYVFWNFMVQKLPLFFDGQWVGIGYEILLAFSNQCIGFGFAGLLRRFSVYPAKSIWPSILPTVALSRALLVPEHEDSRPINGWTMSRYKFFFIVFCSSFAYYWLPGYLFQALSVFNWMTWIKPDNFNLAMITGSNSGLGFNPWSTFDWVVLNQNLPFQSPFFAFFQQFIGTLLGGFIIIAIYWSGRKWTQYIPINTSTVYANDGTPYQVTKVLTNNKLDVEKYKAYSPPFYSAANLVVYGAFFAFYPLNFVYMFVDQWKTVRTAMRGVVRDMSHDLGSMGKRVGLVTYHLVKFDFKGAKEAYYANQPERLSMLDGYHDAHATMMMAYPEAPDWWFLAVLIVSFVFGIIIVCVYPIDTPVWTLFFVVAINGVYLIPMTIIYSMTGITEGLNVLVELIIGYALPGNAQALMLTKAYGYNINGQADNYISDQKMAHYAKIPPRAVFRGQLISTLLTSLCSVGVMNWLMSNIDGLCDLDQPQKFTCANGSRIFYSAAVMWGSIGPKRVFDQLYPELRWCFLIGFLVAIVFLVGQKYGSTARTWYRSKFQGGVSRVFDKTVLQFLSWFKVVNPAVVCNGMLLWAPLNLTYSLPGLYGSFVFHYYIRRHFTAWWEKYTYVMVAAMTGSTAFCAIIIFFAVQYHPKDVSWWGNNVPFVGVDGMGATLQTVNATLGEYFGPRKGTFH
ncbi:oligopeptide transporter 2 [Trichomonascus vanleenenianus]|uniref:oligopeptide transporter 2 n=1 Tax=Trichomonascus vanleenenianus TaxID=2268995 RepID=UPI003ECA2C7F